MRVIPGTAEEEGAQIPPVERLRLARRSQRPRRPIQQGSGRGLRARRARSRRVRRFAAPRALGLKERHPHGVLVIGHLHPLALVAEVPAVVAEEDDRRVALAVPRRQAVEHHP